MTECVLFTFDGYNLKSNEEFFKSIQYSPPHENGNVEIRVGVKISRSTEVAFLSLLLSEAQVPFYILSLQYTPASLQNKKWLFIILNLLSVASFVIILSQNIVETFLQLEIFEVLHGLFNDNVNSFKAYLDSNAQLFLQDQSQLHNITVPLTSDSLLKIEAGFTSEIVQRNRIRLLIKNIFSSIEYSTELPRVEGAFGSKFLCLRFSLVLLLGFLDECCTSISCDPIQRQAIIQQAVRKELNRIERGMLCRFHALFDHAADFISLQTFDAARSEALSELCQHIFQWTYSSIATKKSIQTKIRSLKVELISRNIEYLRRDHSKVLDLAQAKLSSGAGVDLQSTKLAVHFEFMNLKSTLELESSIAVQSLLERVQFEDIRGKEEIHHIFMNDVYLAKISKILNCSLISVKDLEERVADWQIRYRTLHHRKLDSRVFYLFFLFCF